MFRPVIRPGGSISDYDECVRLAEALPEDGQSREVSL
jgi:hypothetical protein